MQSALTAEITEMSWEKKHKGTKYTVLSCSQHADFVLGDPEPL